MSKLTPATTFPAAAASRSLANSIALNRLAHDALCSLVWTGVRAARLLGLLPRGGAEWFVGKTPRSFKGGWWWACWREDGEHGQDQQQDQQQDRGQAGEHRCRSLLIDLPGHWEVVVSWWPRLAS